MANKAASRVLDMAETVNRFAPGYYLDRKSASAPMRLLGRALSLIGLKSFDRYWTTIPHLHGSTTYRPDDGGDDEFAAIAHEGLHAQQSAADPVRYAALYLFPASLPALGAAWFLVAALLGMPLWPALLSLVGLVPGWAPFRSRYEAAAYEVSIAARYWYRAGMSAAEQEAEVSWAVAQFTGGAYFWMDRFGEARLRRRFDAWFAMLRAGAGPTRTAYLVEIKKLCDRYREEDASQ